MKRCRIGYKLIHREIERERKRGGGGGKKKKSKFYYITYLQLLSKRERKSYFIFPFTKL